ncbi:MAG TPA: hypothetical protein PK639_04020 [Candidatus Woesebacteria bacterium]|nr:hypothetical protein [Candidatus Woesebacteria bacterium]
MTRKPENPNVLGPVDLQNRLYRGDLTPEQLVATYSSSLVGGYCSFYDICRGISVLGSNIPPESLAKLLVITDQLSQKYRKESHLGNFPGQDIRCAISRILDDQGLQVAGIQLRKTRH